MRFYLSIGAGMLAALVLAEVLLRALPVNSGARMQATSDAAPYARYLPDQEVVYSFGWSFGNARHLRTSREGFTNTADMGNKVGDKARVLVVGDSFIESLMLDYPLTVQGRLDAMLGGGVYAASASANGLADSLRIAQVFIPRIHPRNVVLFVEPTDVSGILAEAQRGHSAFVLGRDGVAIVHSPYVESGIKVKLLRSALMRYVYYNLKFPDWLTGKFKPAATATATAWAAGRDTALRYYLEQLDALGRREGVKFTFLLDGDRKAMYANNKASERTWKGDDRAVFLAAARRHGFEVADMQPVFERDWAVHRERLDFLPMDGHWNGVAHRLAAEQLLPLLARDGRAAAGP